MRLLLVLILISGCATSTHYKVPRASKNYVIQREIIGYQCPPGLYLDMKSFSCQRDRYSGFIELDSTELTISRDTVVSKYDTEVINVNRN